MHQQNRRFRPLILGIIASVFLLIMYAKTAEITHEERIDAIFLKDLSIEKAPEDNPNAWTLFKYSGYAFGMDFSVTVGSLEPLSFVQMKSIESRILETFQNIDSVFNQWNPHSEISQFNAEPAGKEFCFSQPLSTLLQIVDRVFKESEHLFDPTVHPLQALWKEGFKKGVFPPQEAIDSLRSKVGWEKVCFTGTHAKKAIRGMALTLDSLSKGYGVDLLVEGLTEMGYANIFVEWGGELRAYGHHPSGRPWMVAIRDAVSIDGENAKSLIQFPLEDSAIATSGNYLQQWRCEGRCYTHIINPLTGIPLEVTDQMPTSVTVLAQSCAEADAYATACMLFPSRNAATEWANAVTVRNPTLVFWIY